MTYGLDSTGLEIPSFDTIKNEMQQYVRDNFKTDYTIRSDTVDGMFFIIFTFLIYVLWQQIQLVYNAFIPSFATGINLDNVNELRGSYREGASATTVSIQVYGLAGTIIPQNAIISNKYTGDKYYIENTIVTPDDGSGFGTKDGVANCLTLGAIDCPANTLTVIETSVNGWLTVNNATDGLIGSDVESDDTFRQRAKIEVALSGSGTYDAIYSNLSNLDDIPLNNVYIFENDSEIADAQGRPSGSFEVIVNGGDTEQIAQTIFENKPVGIQSVSTADINIIPVMTANDAPLGECKSSSSTTSNDAYKAADNNDETYWEAETDENEYWQYKLSEITNILVFKLKASSDPTTAPKTIVYKAGNTESTLNTLYSLPTQQTWSANEEREFVIPYYSEEYLYHRIEFIDNNGGSTIQLSEISLLPYKKVVDITTFNNIKKRSIFSRSINIPIYLIVTLKLNSDATSNIENTVKQNIVDFGKDIGVGKNVIGTSFIPTILNTDGVDYVTSVKVGIDVDPVTDSVAIQDGEISTYSINKISISYL